MSLRESIYSMQGVPASRDFVPVLCNYWFRDGWLIAGDGRYVMGVPCPDSKIDMLIPAAAMDLALKHLPLNITLTQKDTVVRVASGKYSATLPIYNQCDFPFNAPEGPWQAIDEGFVDVVNCTKSFISENAIHGWSRGACFRGDKVYATNNKVIVCTPTVLQPMVGDIILPSWILERIVAYKQDLTYISFNENHVCLKWENGAWLRAQLLEGKFPEQIDTILGTDRETPVLRTDPWLDALKYVVGVGEGPVKLYADMIVGVRGTIIAEAEATTVLPPERNYIAFDGPALLAAAEFFTEWDPTQWPKPCPFKSARVQGVIAGMEV